MCLYVVGRHRWRGLSIGVCRKGVVETLGERPKEKNQCARWIECRGRGRDAGVCMHERKLALASYKEKRIVKV